MISKSRRAILNIVEDIDTKSIDESPLESNESKIGRNYVEQNISEINSIKKLQRRPEYFTRIEDQSCNKCCFQIGRAHV